VSPLLANIVLNKLAWRLEEKGYRFVRYADDFVVVCETRRPALVSPSGRRQCLGGRPLRESRTTVNREHQLHRDNGETVAGKPSSLPLTH
jgi:hypothetical protein